MRRKNIVATVEADDSATVDFEVTNDRKVTLTFPNAVYTPYAASRSPFRKHLTPDEARAIGQALLDAADEVTGAAPRENGATT